MKLLHSDRFLCGINCSARARIRATQCTLRHRVESARQKHVLRAQDAQYTMTEGQAEMIGTSNGENQQTERQLVVPVDGSEVRPTQQSCGSALLRCTSSICITWA